MNADSPWRGFEPERKQHVDARHLLLLVHLIAALGTLMLMLVVLPPLRGRLMVLLLAVGAEAVAAGHFLPGQHLCMGDLEERALRVLDQHLGDRLHVHRHADRRHGATTQPAAHRKSEHKVLHVLLVRVVRKVEGAYASSLYVERYLAVREGHATARAHPSRAHFRYLGESMVADTTAPRPSVTVAASGHGALRHPNLC